MEEVRYELNHEGKIVEGNAELSSNIEGILNGIFSQYNNTYRELEINGPYRFIEVTSPNGEKRYFHLYVGKVRNEKRNPYEKKIQLNGFDPTLTDRKSSIILGVYVYDKDDDYKNAVFVGFPINDNINYASNPSLRGGTSEETEKRESGYGCGGPNLERQGRRQQLPHHSLRLSLPVRRGSLVRR